MKKVLVCIPFSEAEKEQLKEAARDAEVLFEKPGEITLEMLRQADALIGNLPPQLIRECPGLSWVQLNSSGADAYVKPGVLGKDTLLTSATGSYGLGIAEYMVAMLLVMMKKIPAYLENQKKGLWKDEGMVTTPYGKRVLIVGTGDIGLEFAKRMRPFGCVLAGVRRRSGVCPEALDEIYGMAELETELGKADVVALCLPGTKETEGLFDERLLSGCKEGAYLMNVGRGTVVSTDALAKPEICEKFAGIWLDVCDPEPLPADHPLYTMPNVLLTPHITGGFHLDYTLQTIFSICLHNLKAWQGEGEYISVIDKQTGYCRS